MDVVDLENADQSHCYMNKDQLLEQYHIHGEDDERYPISEFVGPQSGICHCNNHLHDHQNDGQAIETLESFEQKVQQRSQSQIDHGDIYEVKGRVVSRELVVDLIAHHNTAVEYMDEQEDER